MQPFFDATPLLGDDDALRTRFDQDGYLFVRGAADRAAIERLHIDTTDILADLGWFHPDTDPLDAISNRVPTVEGEHDYFAAYDRIQRLESFHRLPHTDGVLGLMRKVLGESAWPHPLSVMRLVFPDNEQWATPPHQDYPNNQGTPDLIACWMPLHDCPAERGSLSILAGSHRFGVLPLEFSLGAGNATAFLDERMAALDWVGGDFAVGDAVIFGSHTVHRSLPNASRQMRLSADYRFQRENEPLTEGCLGTHFGRVSWDEVYQGWTSTDLIRYWENKEFEIVEWDDSMHDFATPISDHIRERMVYDLGRLSLGESKGWDPVADLDELRQQVTADLRAHAAQQHNVTGGDAIGGGDSAEGEPSPPAP